MARSTPTRTAAVTTALLAAAAAATGVQAQDGGARAQPAPPPAATPAPVGNPTLDLPPDAVLHGRDGRPLSPELQRMIRESMKNQPLPPLTAAPPNPHAAADEGSVVVTAGRRRGAVLSAVPPEQSFSPTDIRARGAANIQELLQSIAPQVASGRGRDDGGPVVLLNGKRIASFGEIATIPTEAIERMEVFPEEVALSYGYRADQKVVNVVTFERFRSQIAQANYAIPTDGGRDTIGAGGTMLRIAGDTRYSLDGEYNRSTALFESERDVRQLTRNETLGRFRTLLPATRRFVLNGTVAGVLDNDLSGSLNGRFEDTVSRSAFGLAAGDELDRDAQVQTAHFGFGLNGRDNKWSWMLTGNYDQTRGDTRTDRTDLAEARDRAGSVNRLIDADLLISGPVVDLPAGPVTASVTVGGALRDFTGRATVRGVASETDLSRDRVGVQASIDVPILARTLSASANAQVERLSDFGRLGGYGYGLRWAPRPTLNLIALITNEQGAPTMEQLGAPLVVTPNLRIFDFVRGETVDIARISGGNPALKADDRRVISLGLNAKPFAKRDLIIDVDYLDTRIGDPIVPFPVALPALEAAFPGRFGRDAAGRLIRIDGTPLNFAKVRQEQLRWGLNFTRTLGPAPPGFDNVRVMNAPNMAEAQRKLPPNATMITSPPGSPMSQMAENLASRLFFGISHVWRLSDEVLVRDGGPVLDYLDGAAVDIRGGRPRHEIEAQAGAFKRSLGARIAARWQSGTRVHGAAADGSGDLAFSPYTTVSVSLFANPAGYFGPARTPNWLKGTRISLSISNLFNAGPEARDRGGAIPINYQPDYLNPIGRSVGLSIRKMF